jgi:Domain of unknown function (DUF4279)
VTRVELAILIRGDHPSISALAALGVGRAWRAGEPTLASPTIRHKAGGWEIASNRPLAEPLRTQLDAVLDSIAGFWPAVCEAAAVGETVLSVALYVTEGPEVAATDLSADQMAKLAELGARLDFDIYQFVPEREG